MGELVVWLQAIEVARTSGKIRTNRQRFKETAGFTGHSMVANHQGKRKTHDADAGL
jgi:hypothetical protein